MGGLLLFINYLQLISSAMSSHLQVKVSMVSNPSLFETDFLLNLKVDLDND